MSNPAPRLGDQANAYTDSIRLPLAEVVARLRGILGARLVAYLGSVQETRAVRQWADGLREPSSDVASRLRTAYHAVALLSDKDSPEVVQAWFQGMNPRMGDVSPARMLREAELDQAGPQVLAAARAFIAEASPPTNNVSPLPPGQIDACPPLVKGG